MIRRSVTRKVRMMDEVLCTKKLNKKKKAPLNNKSDSHAITDLAGDG